MYVVAGVTGNTGKVVAETLLAAKQPVRVIVRNEAQGATWRAQGAEVAIASLDDTAALTRALTGATGAYLLVPPTYASSDMRGDQARTVAAIGEAVRASGVPHVVALSSHGAQHESGTGPIESLHALEQTLTKSTKNVTALRAPYFIENFAQVLGEVTGKGVFPTFLEPDRRIPMAGTLDIGRAAAALLLEPATGVRVVELFGPEELSPNDVRALLAGILGRELTLQAGPLEYVVPALTAQGLPQNVAERFAEMLAAFHAGRVVPVGAPAITRRGTVPAKDVLAGLLQASAV